MPLNENTISGLSTLYRSGSARPEDTLKDLGTAIKARDRHLNSYVKFDVGAGLVPAQTGAVRAPTRGAPTPLEGIPISIKDNICVRGQEASCGSKILQGYIAPYHATVINRLLKAGAVPYGRTNMDEFAFGSSTETSYYGPTRNPRDTARVPGGSSGGSAAAVAGHLAIAALGSDTGGSIRQPAALCGVVGLKPTYGRVSRYGLVAFASSLDQIGPITKDVRDAAILLGVLAGHDPLDSTSADLPVPDYAAALGKGVKGLKIGLPKEYFQEGLSKEVGALIQQAVKKLESLGAEIKQVSLPNTPHAVSVYYIVAPSEASSNLSRFDGVRFGRRAACSTLLELYEKSRGEGFGAEAKRRIILGTYSLSSGYYDAYYLRAMKVRTLIKRDFDEAFKSVDLLLTPTAPATAFKLGEKTSDPIQMYLSDIYTISANLAGVPALSMPCGVVNGLPAGLQFIGKPFDEAIILQAAYAYEQATDHHKKLGNVK